MACQAHSDRHCGTCRSPRVFTFLVQTVDLVPPEFTGGRPYVRSNQPTAFDLVVQQNKTGRAFFVVVQQVIAKGRPHAISAYCCMR